MNHNSAALGGFVPPAQLPSTRKQLRPKAYHSAGIKQTPICHGYVSLHKFKTPEAEPGNVPRLVRTSIRRKTSADLPQSCQISKSCFLDLRPHSPADACLRSRQHGATPLSPRSPRSSAPCLLPSPVSPVFSKGTRLSQQMSMSMTGGEELARKSTWPKDRVATPRPRTTLPNIGGLQYIPIPSTSYCRGSR